MSADPVVAARIGGLVAVALAIGLGVASCQANEDRALRARPVQAPPVTVWTPRPTPTLIPPTRPDGEPAWCVGPCASRARTAVPARPTP